MANPSNSRAGRKIGVGRAIGTTAIVVSAVAVLGAAAVGAFSLLVARKVITPSKKRVEDLRVYSRTEDTITLSRTLDTLLPGTYSFWFDRGAGHARIGDIQATTPTTVTRKLLGVSFGDLEAFDRGYLGSWVYLSPADLEVPFDTVQIETGIGPAPAWLIPAVNGRERWLIGVHGRGVRKQESLRVIDVARRCGYTTLLVSYRNDGDAPDSSDGRYGLGDTEWQDVDAAIGYAIEHGATEVVLMGWSMGGATVLQALTRSENAAVIRGLILESPVVDWVPTLNYQAAQLRIPKPVGQLAAGLISQPWSSRLTGQDAPIALDRLDFVARAAELDVPILLLHSADDGFVPPDASRALAAARPDIVTYDEFTVARHVKLWNYDPDRWNSDIGGWLSRL
jgi:pimeloyl-ACP methyl ester carboxylesterase